MSRGKKFYNFLWYFYSKRNGEYFFLSEILSVLIW